MRTKRRNRRKIIKPILICTFSPLVVFIATKLVPFLTVSALFCAGINMPEGAKTVLVSDYKQSQTIDFCDTTIEFNDTENENAPIVPTDTNEVRKDGDIIYKQYKKQGGTSYINLLHGQIRNCSHLSNEQVLEYATMRPEIKIAKSTEPQVLIYHTHATEAYEPYERLYYDLTRNTRNTDTKENMVAVGDAIATELEALGIGVIHSSTLHDYPAYTGAYSRSAETIKTILSEHPSIKVVLDIHRDAIESNGQRYAAVTNIDGKNASQVMIISGCDDGTMNMPNYLQNLRLATAFQQQIEADYPTLTRPILFDYRKYNQDLSTGALLFEIGSHGNTLEQSVYTGHLIGKSIGKVLLGLE